MFTEKKQTRVELEEGWISKKRMSVGGREEESKELGNTRWCVQTMPARRYPL